MMAYMNVEKKNELAPGIKKVLAEYGMRGTIAKDDYALSVNLKSGPIDFGTDSVNEFHIDRHFTGVEGVSVEAQGRHDGWKPQQFRYYDRLF